MPICAASRHSCRQMIANSLGSNARRNTLKEKLR
jgi:hypothetical protein